MSSRTAGRIQVRMRMLRILYTMSDLRRYRDDDKKARESFEPNRTHRGYELFAYKMGMSARQIGHDSLVLFSRATILLIHPYPFVLYCTRKYRGSNAHAFLNNSSFSLKTALKVGFYRRTKYRIEGLDQFREERIGRMIDTFFLNSLSFRLRK